MVSVPSDFHLGGVFSLHVVSRSPHIELLLLFKEALEILRVPASLISTVLDRSGGFEIKGKLNK